MAGHFDASQDERVKRGQNIGAKVVRKCDIREPELKKLYNHKEKRSQLSLYILHILYKAQKLFHTSWQF